jgi:hypothetical protein
MASAQTADFERILVPIAIKGEINGALGSRWISRLAITNTAAARVAIFGYDPYPGGCVIALCPPVPTTPPGITFFPSVSPGTVTQGAILKVERAFAPAVRFDLRVQDVSRQAQTWGTEIPVVREANLFAGPLQLLDVPLTPAFRSALRLYDVDARPGAQVRLRFYAVDPTVQSPVAIVGPPAQHDRLLGERVVTFQTEQRGGDAAFDLGYAEFTNLAALPELQGAELVRIEVTPITDSLRFWAFAGTTNNDTQHVTLITPQ